MDKTGDKVDTGKGTVKMGWPLIIALFFAAGTLAVQVPKMSTAGKTEAGKPAPTAKSVATKKSD